MKANILLAIVATAIFSSCCSDLLLSTVLTKPSVVYYSTYQQRPIVVPRRPLPPPHIKPIYQRPNIRPFNGPVRGFGKRDGLPIGFDANRPTGGKFGGRR